MHTLWFCLVAWMLAVYVVLDGFDLGVGIVYFGVAREETERRQVLQSIGPVWDGNEVWLLAAGGTLYFAFPSLYAASFSGFYLPLMIVLWLLILRGIAIEFRGHVEGPVWKPFWDAVFTAASALLAIFFGAALGNVIRGVPLDDAGFFFLPLWTDFRLGRETGILDWYTVLVGLLAYAALTLHGALWVALKTEAAVHRRAQHVARTAWWTVAGMTVAVTLFTLRIQPQVLANLGAYPWGFVFPLIALAGLGGAAALRGERMRFLGSCAYIVGMLAGAAFGLYPYVLPSNTDPKLSLTIHNAAAGAYGLRVGLAWWIPGMILVVGYFFFLYRRFAGKVSVERDGYQG
jgi:cytochrome d ubiquinol oxidase subunit II